MSGRPVALLLEPGPAAGALRDGLLLRGIPAQILASGEQAVVRPDFDALVLDADLPGQWSGLGLMEALRELGCRAPVLLVGERPGFETCRRALQLGVSDFLLRPIDVHDAVEALEACLGKKRPHGATESFDLEVEAAEGAVETIALELTAFLLRQGVSAPHRLRITSAVTELIDNAVRHAYEPGAESTVAVHVTLEREQVRIEIADRGCGFDTSQPRPMLSGLDRVERLSESFQLSSGAEGTWAELGLELAPLRFAEEGEELGDLDYLVPEVARRLTQRLMIELTGGSSQDLELPSALRPTVGRLLSRGPQPVKEG